MSANSLKKSLILTIFYFIFIIGIFVLQFKNDSILSEKIGNLHVNLVESVDDAGKVSLKNKMSVNFNGLTFSNSDEKSGYALINGSRKNLKLLSWEKPSELSCKFYFDNNISLLFNLSDDSSTAHLSIFADLPENVNSIFIPYSLSSRANILQQNDTKIQIGSKKSTWELSANDIGTDKIAFTKRENVANYSYFDTSKAFSFEQIQSFTGSSETQYLNSLILLKQTLISEFEKLPLDSQFAEQDVVSYVAAMAESGKFNEAQNKVSSSFKKNTSRTFLSAPYFNTLEKMNQNLLSYMERLETLVKYSSETSRFDVYNSDYIADYMCMHPGSKSISLLLENTAKADAEKIPLLQAAGILYVYSELYEKNKTLSEKLLPITDALVSKIEKMCSLDDDVITISEAGTFLSVKNAIIIGNALICYGKVKNNKILQNSGRLIVNSYLKNCSSFDLKTLAEIYPIVVRNNRFYPHFSILTFANGKAIWAYTCANNIGYENNNAGTITLTIDFPVSSSHYVIFSGIPHFESIYIYDLKFRTDSRFETYNSSGYIYKHDSESLLLKSRHKKELETIRLELNKEIPVTDENPAIPNQENQTDSEEVSAEITE